MLLSPNALAAISASARTLDMPMESLVTPGLTIVVAATFNT